MLHHSSVLVLALSLALPGGVVQAQERTSIALGFGPITSYPEDFTGGGCEGRYIGANLGVARTVSAHVALEASVAWTGSTAVSCTLDALSRPAPEDGTEYRHAILPDAIPGETFWATRVGTVVTPGDVGPITPLLRLTAGRLWSKEMWTWTWGGGVRYGLGRHAILVDVERWHLGYDVLEETWVFRAQSSDQLQARETVERTPRPWFVRIGWEWSVGR